VLQCFLAIFVGECNLARRNLTVLQRVQLAERLRPFYEEKAIHALSTNEIRNVEDEMRQIPTKILQDQI
jgi:hypothetical protein